MLAGVVRTLRLWDQTPDTVGKASRCREQNHSLFSLLSCTASERRTQKQQSNTKRRKGHVTQRSLVRMTSAQWSRSASAVMVRRP